MGRTPPLAVFALSVITLLGGCSAFDSEATPEPVLEGTSWVLVSPVYPDGRLRTVRFEGGGMEGSAGCNHYGGQARLAGSVGGRAVLRVGAVTRRFCGGEVAEHEGAYLRALDRVRAYRVHGDRLTLSSARPLVFHRNDASPYLEAE